MYVYVRRLVGFYTEPLLTATCRKCSIHFQWSITYLNFKLFVSYVHFVLNNIDKRRNIRETIGTISVFIYISGRHFDGQIQLLFSKHNCKTRILMTKLEKLACVYYVKCNYSFEGNDKLSQTISQKGIQAFTISKRWSKKASTNALTLYNEWCICICTSHVAGPVLSPTIGILYSKEKRNVFGYEIRAYTPIYTYPRRAVL